MTATALPAIDEWTDFFALKFPADILTFSPSKKVAERVEFLVFKEKTEGVSSEEKSELDIYMVLEHIMRIAKAKAKKRLTPA